MKTFATLFLTEMKLALRSFDMVIFAIIFPVAITILLGIIGVDPRQADFAGVAALAVFASGLMGLPLTLCDYRHRHVLRNFQASPIHPGLILAAQTLTQATFALAAGFMVMSLARFGFGQVVAHPDAFILAWLVLLCSTFGLGYLVAALAPNAKIAGIACSILYFPVLLLSGATIPTGVFPPLVRDILGGLPASQGILLLKQATLGSLPAGHGLAFTATGPLPWLYLALIGIAGYLVAVKHFRWN